ncbi:MAG TPA: restriction endonuclease subunit S, partial [Puia sp.]|nr:restriction endonuclease subunit S [Puia sp.]
ETVKNPEVEGIERYIGLEHIEPGNLHISTWGNVSDGTMFTKRFTTGQVLFGKRRAYQKKAALADFDGICSGDILVLEANEKVIDKNLFPFLISSDRFFDYAVHTSAGSLSPRTKFQDLAKFEFFLPPKEQQAKLAGLLWAADIKIEKYKKLIKKIEIYQTVYALANFQDKVRPSSSIKTIAEVNPSMPKNLPGPDSEVSFLAMADVSEAGKIINFQKRKFKDVRKGYTYFGEGDTLFAKITPCMENGKGALIEHLVNNIGFGSTEFHIIRPFKESDRLYCYYLSRMKLFRTEAEKLMVGSAGHKRVQSDFFDYFTFHVPDEWKRQKFGETMKQIEAETEKISDLKELAKRIQNRYINQIFST